MIRLDLKREPHWLDRGHGVRVQARPCTTALMMAARAEVQRAALPDPAERIPARVLAGAGRAARARWPRRDRLERRAGKPYVGGGDGGVLQTDADEAYVAFCDALPAPVAHQEGLRQR